ncbi:MAG: regulatory protein RecX [Candidatus Omnitrophica bacterium]|nr:regulatory protein RecX [Candidatus Omnitrophota bacterium]
MKRKIEQPNTIIKAKEYVYRLLNFRLRSQKEIEDKLTLKHFSTALITETIEYFKQHDLINDREFAKKWIFFRQSKLYGKNRIRFELKQKGIKDDIIEEELSEGFADSSEEEFVCQLVKKQYGKYQNIDPQKRIKRLYDYLRRRGYHHPVIMKVLNRYDER